MSPSQRGRRSRRSPSCGLLRPALQTLRPCRAPGAALVVALCATACSHGATAVQDGALTVTVSAPAGITPQVLVTGPNGYQRTINSTQTLTGLGAGTYVIAAKSVMRSDPLVSVVEAGSVTSSQVDVTDGQTASSSVTYQPRPGSGVLWVVGNIDTTTNLIYGFTPAQLAASGAPTPAIALSIPHTPTKFGDVDAMAFDSAGNLWLGHYQLNTVTEVAANALGTSGVVTEAVTISGAGLHATQGLTFDAHGNLWVSNNLPIDSAYTIVEYSAAQLAATGSPAPVATISGPALVAPEQMAFDAQGDLWVANSNSYTLVAYTPAQLVAAGLVTPAVTLSADTAIGYAISPAFDAQGNLWLANAFLVPGNGSVLSTIAEFPSAAIAASGSPAPKQTIVLPGSTPTPWQIAFDNSGNLWVVTSQGHQILEYTAAQLAAGGNPSPMVTISLGALYPSGLAFDPHPSTLPLH